jgi:hypothetical protein
VKMTPMPGARRRSQVVAVAVIAGAALVVGVGLLGKLLFPSNSDILVRNATSSDLSDVVVLRGEGDDAEEVARFPRIAPNEQSLAPAGLGPISVEFTDARGRWIAARAMWRDEDDVGMQSKPSVLEVTADTAGRAPVRRKP